MSTQSVAEKVERVRIDKKSIKQGSALVQSFLQTTGLKLGEYRLVEGGETCAYGEIYILDFKDELTVMLGARPLLTAVGAKSKAEKDRDCILTSEATFSRNRLEGHSSEKCNFTSGPLSYDRRVKIQVKGSLLEIESSETTPDKPSTTHRCILRRK